MKIVPIQERTPALVERLVKVWRDSVKETHSFLSAAEIDKIRTYVPQALENIPHLVVAEDDNGLPVAFMGIAERKLEMLFVAPQLRGRGVGRKLLEYGIQEYAVSELGVNEQNPQARGFYEHMGFCVYKRAETDEQGGPYPILYMKLS